MAGLVELPRSRVSLLGVIVGGLLIGAGGFGLFRVTNANPAGDLPPLPASPLPPVSEGRPDPVGLPPLIPAGVPVPPVLSPVLPPLSPVLPPLAPDLPKPGEVLPPPAPLPPPPLPVVPPPTAPKSPQLPPALPDPIGPKFPALPDVPPAPKPVAPPTELPPLPRPVAPDLPIPPGNPDLNLRPPVPGHTVNSKPLPAEVSPAPRPAVTVLPTPAGPLDPPTAPGDPTMTLALRQTMLSAALGVGLALTPSPAFAQEKPAEPDLKKQVEDLRKEVDALKKQNEVQADLILGRSDGKDTLPEDKGLMKRVKTLEEAIKRIEGKLDAAMKGDTKQVVGSSPIGDAAKGMGTIRLINEYPTDVSIVLNGTSHPLKANELKEVVIPAGEFAYELIATGATKTNSTIKDGERVTLRIR